MKKNFFAFILLAAVSAAVYSQTHLSTQPHAAQINTFASKKGSVFTAGNDGFVVKWAEDGRGEHAQLSDLQIKMIALNKNNDDIALYETDNLSIYRISVWDWKTKKRKFAQRFSDSVLSLSYSGNSTYLLVGTASTNGFIFLNAATGTPLASKISEKISLVSYAMTNAAETTLLVYSQTGYLTYYDLRTGKTKAKFSCEQGLQQPVLFNKNLILAGTKNDKIYFIDAISGKPKAEEIASSAPLLVPEAAADAQFIYCIEKTIPPQQYALKKISADTLKTEEAAEKITDFCLQDSYTVSSCIAENETIYIGSNEGNLFALIPPANAQAVKNSKTITLESITKSEYDIILDAAFSPEKNAYYFLANSGIYETADSAENITKIMDAMPQQNILDCANGFILWKKDSSLPVLFYSFETKETKQLFVPSKPIHTIKLHEQNLLFIESTASVSLFDFQSNKKTTLFTGSGIQDAILYSDTELLVAKTSASEPKASLLKVDITNGETVPLKISGDIVLSLSSNASSVYGISININGSKKTTEIFYITKQTNKYAPLVKWDDEDINAFLTLSGTSLYTNIGKTAVRSINLSTRKQILLKRASSLPIKLLHGGEKILILNSDGGISWFNSKTNVKTADWYLTVGGQWFEL
ncbi:MAG: WD40 repeat domain-containing protein [Bacteroides sp.]|nr:WD40 repeat domain-containing protein [Prevotella sp.]MCM1408219.1 WD40 repeat domain-containing protein [Treponema brennaborense]MCM1469543.1 WD40 repeat domain-containing protein [Bacteroides sp.]